jgi:hypothetical protein
MNTSVASDFETPRPSRGGGAEKVAILAVKLLVTGACFWYVSRQIDWRQVWSAIPLLDFRWAGLAILVRVWSFACPEDRSAARSVAIFQLVRNIGRRRPSRSCRVLVAVADIAFGLNSMPLAETWRPREHIAGESFPIFAPVCLNSNHIRM